MFIHASGSSFLILVFGFVFPFFIHVFTVLMHWEEIYVQKKKHIRFSDLYIDNVFSEGTDSHRDENMYNRYPARDNTYQHMRWHL